MNILKIVKMSIGYILLFPHIIVYQAIKGGVISEDLHRWKEIKGMNGRGDISAFVDLLLTNPEMRSVFYWRLGKFVKYLFFWMPGRSNLYIFTKPHNVGGGFYVGHGWGTVVNASSIGRNFRVGQNCTVGSRNCKEPIIGNDVSIWAHAVVLGDIQIGDNSDIGAGAVVVKSVSPRSVVVPAKSVIIRQDGERVNLPL